MPHRNSGNLLLEISIRKWVYYTKLLINASCILSSGHYSDGIVGMTPYVVHTEQMFNKFFERYICIINWIHYPTLPFPRTLTFHWYLIIKFKYTGIFRDSYRCLWLWGGSTRRRPLDRGLRWRHRYQRSQFCPRSHQFLQSDIARKVHTVYVFWKHFDEQKKLV